MRVVFAIKSMNVEGGGAERVLSQVASGLAKQGHQIILLTLDDPSGHSFYELHPSIERVYVRIGDPRRSAGVLETLQRIHRMRQVINDIQPDIVVGFMHSMFIPLGLALLGLRIPVIASEHIVPDHYKSRPLQALLLLLSPLFTRRMTVVSDQVRESYPSMMKSHITVIPNPVFVRTSEHSICTKQQHMDRKILLTVGRLSAQKDHASLIDSFSEISDEVPDWDLRIVGEGELRGELEQQIRTLGLNGRVQLPGIAKDISQEYASAHLFVMPSRYESFGLATAEALAHKLPAVGYVECQGTNLLIKSGVNGLLVKGGMHRSKMLAAALKRLMLSDKLRQKMATAQIDLPIPSLEEVLDYWRELFSVSLSKQALDRSAAQIGTFTGEIVSLIQEVSGQIRSSADLSRNIYESDEFKDIDSNKLLQFTNKMNEAVSFINTTATRINLLALSSTLDKERNRRPHALPSSLARELKETAEKTFQTTQHMEHLIDTISQVMKNGSDTSGKLNLALEELENIADDYTATANETLKALNIFGEGKVVVNSYGEDKSDIPALQHSGVS